MNAKIKTYRDLDIWKKSIDLVKEIYTSTENFPTEETYGLKNQMRRSAVSIPSNIAEGFPSRNNPEYRRFLHISLGSCAELETQITIAKELKYITQNTEQELLEDLDHISRMTRNLIKKL